MNSESFSEGNQPAVSPVNSIGSQLKRAREELRLTITDIARQLRLTEERIVSLESDNYENMPGMTFVKGYLRAYARLVNLPADELILDFERLNLIPETKTLILTSHRQPVFLSNKSLRWLVYLISIGLLILAATWWSSSANNDATNLSSTELKHQPIKNMSPTADTTSAVNNPVNAANTTANTAVNTQAAKSGPETNAANTAPAPTAADPKTNLPTGQEATSAASQQLPTTSAGTSSSDSTQTSDKQIKAESSTDGSTDEDDVKPHKKPVTRSHSHAQFDEPFDDE